MGGGGQVRINGRRQIRRREVGEVSVNEGRGSREFDGK